MRRFWIALVLLTTCWPVQGIRASNTGVVVEVTADAIKLREAKETNTYKVSEELLTNTNPPVSHILNSAKFTDLKKGSRIRIWCEYRGGDRVCVVIEIMDEPAKEEREREKEKKLEREKGDFNFDLPGDKSG